MERSSDSVSAVSLIKSKFYIYFVFYIKRINWKCKKIVHCNRTYIRILLLLLLEVIRTTTHFNFYHLLVTTCSEGWAPEKRYIRICFDTLNNESAGLHQCLPMPASACQNLYIVRWTRIYIRLLLLFKNPPSPSFSIFAGFLCIHYVMIQ